MDLAEKIMESREFAVAAHGAQQYGDSNLPYSVHLDAVASALPDILKPCGYLHDVLEDTMSPLPSFLEHWEARTVMLVSKGVLLNPYSATNTPNTVYRAQVRTTMASTMVKLADSVANGTATANDDDSPAYRRNKYTTNLAVLLGHQAPSDKVLPLQSLEELIARAEVQLLEWASWGLEVDVLIKHPVWSRDD